MEDNYTQHNLQHNNTHKVLQNFKGIKYGILYFVIILLVIVSGAGIWAYNILSSTDIYPGVYVKDVSVGGETRESAAAKLNKTHQSKWTNKEIEIIIDGAVKKVSYDEVGASYNIDEAVKRAFEAGRQGNIFQRLYAVFEMRVNNKVIPLHISVNGDKVKSEIEQIARKVDEPVKEHQVEILDDKVVITKGGSGKRINIEKSVKAVIDAIIEDTNATLIFEDIPPKAINADQLYNQVYVKAADAKYEVKDYSIGITPHVIGREIDKEEAEKAIKNSSEKSRFSIPLKLKQPEVLKEALKQQLFKDKLASYTTSFDANYATRSHNIALAASKINGVVLAAGDVFSFNEIVGERTLEKGFQTATGYYGDKLVDDVGGGICQVSTTLYNIVLYSDLEVVKRSSHSMTVSYVPFGQDAAVAYDVLDFQFRNNTSSPIKLISNVVNGTITFELYGVDEMPEKTVEMENITLETISFPIEYIDDPALEQGKTKVKQYGKKGYVVDTYKIIKHDGKQVSKIFITKSSYRPLKQIVLKGTKQVEMPILNEN